MFSIFGALARPSIRSTTRLPFTSTSVGTSATLNRSARSGCSSTSTRMTRRRPRSLRATCASRRSIRRAGPERSDQKKTSRGLGSLLTSVCPPDFVSAGGGGVLFPANGPRKLHWPGMGDWYWIGVCAGLGVGVGVVLAGLLAGTRVAFAAALVLAAGIGVAIGLGL